MTDNAEHECQEAYKDCMATRDTRVEKVVKEAKPWETERELAAKAGVSRDTIAVKKAKLLQSVGGPTDCNNNVAEAIKEVKSYEKRRRRPDWQPRRPRKPEVRKWFNQYLGWTEDAKKQGRIFLLNLSTELPYEAYYDDDLDTISNHTNGGRTVGPQEGSAEKSV